MAKLTHDQAMQRLSDAGIKVKTGVPLDGVQQNTINGIINFKQSSHLDITITGGTKEGIHHPGDYSHANGYKLDIRVGNKSHPEADPVSKYIEKNYDHDLGNKGYRKNGDPIYHDRVPGSKDYPSKNNEYVLELSKGGEVHWDITFRGDNPEPKGELRPGDSNHRDGGTSTDENRLPNKDKNSETREGQKTSQQDAGVPNEGVSFVDGGRAYDTNPPMGVSSEVNQYIQPPEQVHNNQSSEMKQSIQPPDGQNQSIQPPDGGQNQSIQPPDGGQNQSIQPPDGSQDASSSDGSQNSTSSDGGGYDASGQDSSGYNTTTQNDAGYDTSAQDDVGYEGDEDIGEGEGEGDEDSGENGASDGGGDENVG